MSACTCGCCDGVTSRTPAEVHNRPGLSAVAYRVGTHPRFLDSMVAALTDPDRPALGGLTTRDPDDPTIALLDAWAVVADVLTFHTERLAQESWLRTAVDRRSLQELGRLVGHRMAPGVAAETHLAFAVEPPPAVPAAAGRDPGVAPPVTPASVVVPVGTRIQSIPGPDEQPQTFETVAELTARPALNAMPAAATLPGTVEAGDERTWLVGVATNLAAGDTLLFVGGAIADDHWDLAVVETVTPDAAHDRTEVTWTGPLRDLGPAAVPEVVVLRKRIRVFGHNAPGWNAMSADFKDEYLGTDPDPVHSDWPDFVLTAGSGEVVDLDGSHPDVTVGSYVFMDEIGQQTGLFTATSVQELSRAEFAVSGTVTRVGLAGTNYDRFVHEGDPREIVVLAAPEPLDVASRPDEGPVGDDAVVVAADASGLAVEATVVVAGTTTDGTPHAEVAVIEDVSDVGAGRWRLTLEADLARDYVRETVVVHGNVAPATHGETVDEVLGAGRGNATFQRFALSHGPLTHVPATGAEATGPGVASTLVVRVNDVAWDEVSTLHDADPADRAFTSTVDEHGDRVVAFGDGRRGARLPTGTNNVRATYRKGLGTAGNVAAGQLAQLLDRPLGLKGVANPVDAAGGVDPEAPEDARRAIPLRVRTLGRVVSLLDYQDEAAAWPGISKAHATVLPLATGRTIVVTVAPTPGTGDATQRLADLATAMREHGDPHVALQVVAQRLDTFRLSLRVTVADDHDPDLVLAGIAQAVRTAFGFDARDFLDPVHASEVVAVAHEVAGVVGLDLDRLYAPGLSLPPGLLADRLVPRQPALGSPTTVLAAGLLVVDDEPFDTLEVVS